MSSCRSARCSDHWTSSAASRSPLRSITSPATRWPSKPVAQNQSSHPVERGDQSSVPPRPRDLLDAAQAQERAGCITEAIACYTAAIQAAEQAAENAVLAEALRRLGAVHHHRNEAGQAQLLCQRSYEIATRMGDDMLAAEALNALAVLEF